MLCLPAVIAGSVLFSTLLAPAVYAAAAAKADDDDDAVGCTGADCFGITIGQSVERMTGKLGLPQPNMTPAELAHPSVSRWRQASSVGPPPASHEWVKHLGRMGGTDICFNLFLFSVSGV